MSNTGYQQDSTPEQLYELLLSRNFEPDILDSTGKRITDPAEAEVLSFDYQTENKNYGTVVILINSDDSLELFYGDNLGRGMERDDKDTWYDFLYQLRMFAKRNLLAFELKNMNRLKFTMQGMAAIKEGLFESYYGNKHTSYSDGPQKTRLIIKHNKALESTDPRYRYIESIFVETEEGERFKLPFTKLSGGRAIARHCAEGGTPYDPLGQHICGMVEQITRVGKFVRKLRGKEVANETEEMQATAGEHYNRLRKQLKSLASQRGYRAYRESWSPDQITESDRYVNQLDNLLTENYRTGTPSMKEIKLFESWAARLVEGTLASPKTPEQLKALKDLLSAPLEVGPDAINAQELLYGLVDDDELFDLLSELADRDPTADARDLVIDWMQSAQHSNPGYAEVLSQLDDVTPQVDEGNNWRTDTQIQDQSVAEEIGDPTDDPEFYGDDDRDASEFYVIIYDEDEDSTFVGKLQQTDRRWEEIAVAGQAPNQWGGGYMSYISPQDIMNWLFQDYRRGYTVKGPYYSKQEALQVARNEFGIREDARSEYQANQFFKAQQKLPNKQFSDFTEWRKYMTAFDPAVKFYKKTTQQGEVILAKDGDRVLGSFSPANKFGFIGEEVDAPVSESFPYDVDHMPGRTIKHQSNNCTTCHGRQYMYRLDGKLYADNKRGATRLKCPTCHGTGSKPTTNESADSINTLSSLLKKLT